MKSSFAAAAARADKTDIELFRLTHLCDVIARRG